MAGPRAKARWREAPLPAKCIGQVTVVSVTKVQSDLGDITRSTRQSLCRKKNPQSPHVATKT
jgi:hypothetical protein